MSANDRNSRRASRETLRLRVCAGSLGRDTRRFCLLRCNRCPWLRHAARGGLRACSPAPRRSPRRPWNPVSTFARHSPVGREWCRLLRQFLCRSARRLERSLEGSDSSRFRDPSGSDQYDRLRDRASQPGSRKAPGDYTIGAVAALKEPRRQSGELADLTISSWGSPWPSMGQFGVPDPA